MRYVAVFLLGAILSAGGVYFATLESEPAAPPVVETVAAADDSVNAELAKNLQSALDISNARIAELEAELAAANAMSAGLMESMEEAKEEVAEAEEELDEDEERKATLDEIRARLAENGVAQAQLKALTEMMYADFINSLDLDPEAKALLREALARSFMEQMALSQYAIQNGEIPWDQVKAWELEELGYLNDQLSGILSADEYRSWEDYAANMEERQLDGALRNQIKAFATGLTPENFDLVMQIAIEEFRAEQLALEQSTTPYTMSENVMYQIRAMQAMRERLQGYLSEEQFAEIENWLTMAENLLMSQLPQDGQ